jgi:alpha-L-fucosidase
MTKGDALYAIGLAWPANGEAVIHSLASTVGTEHVQSVILLGRDIKLQFEQRADGLHVSVPAQSAAKYAYALRVTFDNSSQ